MKKIAITTLKGLGWTLLGLFTALMLLLAAWLASNNRWVDNRISDAVPPALQLPPVTLAPEQNGFYTLAGLTAPTGEDPNRAGQLALANRARDPRGAGQLGWPTAKSADDAVGQAWICNSDRADCLALWQGQAAALEALRARHAEVGARCEALADGGMVMQEVIPQPVAEPKTTADQYAALPLPSVQNWVNCARWLRMGAVLAQARGDTAALRLALQRSQSFSLGLLTQARTLTGNLIAWRLASEHWQVATALAARQPALAAEVLRVVDPLPAQAQDVSRWMAHEAFYSRQVNREMGLYCRPGGLQPDPDTNWWDRNLGCSSFGFMPRATQQLFDRHWLLAMEQARGGPLALVDWQPATTEGFHLGGFVWSNSVGHVLAAVAIPAYNNYGRRQADMVLNHQAAVLALKAAAQPPAQRAAWLAAQPVDERLRARIRLEDGQLLATPWYGGDRRDQPIRYPIPPYQGT